MPTAGYAYAFAGFGVAVYEKCELPKAAALPQSGRFANAIAQFFKAHLTQITFATQLTTSLPVQQFIMPLATTGVKGKSIHSQCKPMRLVEKASPEYVLQELAVFLESLIAK